MLGRPVDEVGLIRMTLLPEVTGTVSVLVVHPAQVPVLSKDVVAAVVPFTRTLAVRAPVVPLANRTDSVAVPDAGAVTVNWAYAPVALVPLQNPLPENPAQSESIVPVQTAGDASASYRVVAACAAVPDNATSRPATRPALAVAMTGLTCVVCIVGLQG